jgi:hypothetical protein
MGEDRSLDEFADAGSDDGSAGDSPDAEGKPDDPDGERATDASAAEPTGSEPTDPESTDPQPTDSEPPDSEPIDADPAIPTATWTTDGDACDRCGESVSRRWTDGDELVCAACKEW